MGITLSWPMESNRGVKACVRASQKAPERDERHRQTDSIRTLYDDATNTESKYYRQ